MEAACLSSDLLRPIEPIFLARPVRKLDFLRLRTPVSSPAKTRCQLKSPPPLPADDSGGADWRSFRARLVAGERAMEPAVRDKWVHGLHAPENGCLLLATERLDGVHIFERTVILVLSMGPVGPTGVILNRPSLMSIREARWWTAGDDPAGAFRDRPLFFGGPLENGLFLVGPTADEEPVKEASGVLEEVMDGLYYGPKERVGLAAEMVKRDVVGAGDFRFFDGYCGWEGEQLRQEIKAGFWSVAACSPSVIELACVKGGVGLWDEVLGLMSHRRVL